MAEKNGSVINFPSVLIMMLLLAGWAATLVVRLPTVVIHGDARWIGEHIWAGIPVLLAVILFIFFVVHSMKWQTRHERKLKRVNDELLWTEGKHPRQLRVQQEQEQKQRAADLKKQAADLKKQAADLKKQDKVQAKKSMLEEIQNQEKRLREARSRQQGLAQT